MTVGSKKSIVYFNRSASDQLRKAGATHLKFGVDWSIAKPLVMICEKQEHGAIELVGGGTKGPGDCVPLLVGVDKGRVLIDGNGTWAE